MNQIIECYLTNNYYSLLKVARKYAKNDDWASELLHEVILQLYNKKDIKIKLEPNDIKYYIIRMIQVNWCYPSSPFYRKYKRYDNELDLNIVIELVDEMYNNDSDKLLEIVEQEFSELDLFNKLIFEKYLTMGSLRKVAEDAKISLASVGNYIKETKELIKTNSINRLNK